MLLGKNRRKPDLAAIRRIKQVLHDALNLTDKATVTLTELACFEEDCPPIETVFGLLRADAPQLQHKIHKPTSDISADDLMKVCNAWGFDVGAAALSSIGNEN